MRLLGQFRGERIRIGLVLALAVAGVLLAMLGPLLIGQATDIIFAGTISQHLAPGTNAQQAVDAARAAGREHYAQMLSHMHLVPGRGIDFRALAVTLLWVFGLYLLSSLCIWWQSYVLNDLMQEIVLRMRADVEAKLHRLPLSYFDQLPRGEVLSRVTNDITNVSQSLQQTLSQLLNALLSLISVVAMMLWVSPLLALVALVTIPVAMALTGAIGKRSQGQFIAQWKHTGELNALIEEAFTGHELVRVFGRSREVAARFDAKNRELYSASFAAQFISGIIMPAMMLVGNLNYVLIAVVGGLRVAVGSMSLGDVQAFIQYSRQFTRPLTQVASMANLLQSGVASAERVYEVLDAQEQSGEPAAPQHPGTLQGRIVFEHVSFRYQPDKPLIEDLSLVAEPGHTIAIVGPTGAGKTTLVNLIMRFYEIDAGRITLDGVDIRLMQRDQLRSRIGMVLQDTWLFHGTIRDNLRYGRPDASDAELLAAAQAAFVDRFVRALPAGYDTVIDEESSNLSAGQKQLITIARAFLTDPALLILDEATSSVDTRTEIQVQHAMATLRRNRTSFVIAHRLSTIRDADLILVMRDGAIVEQGSHEQLLARHGAYFDLYSAQLTAPVAEDTAPAAAPMPRRARGRMT
jgi:ATP-binding cassette, subfamily B, multidrug efflux pump